MKSEELEKLSKDELIRLLLDKNKEFAEKERELKETVSELEAVRVSHRELMMRMEDLIAKYEELVKEKRAAEIKPFIPKTEKLRTETVINELEEIREKKKRRTPTETFLTQLKKAYRGEEDDVVIDYDFDENQIARDTVKLFGQDE